MNPQHVQSCYKQNEQGVSIFHECIGNGCGELGADIFDQPCFYIKEEESIEMGEEEVEYVHSVHTYLQTVCGFVPCTCMNISSSNPIANYIPSEYDNRIRDAISDMISETPNVFTGNIGRNGHKSGLCGSLKLYQANGTVSKGNYKLFKTHKEVQIHNTPRAQMKTSFTFAEDYGDKYGGIAAHKLGFDGIIAPSLDCNMRERNWGRISLNRMSSNMARESKNLKPITSIPSWIHTIHEQCGVSTRAPNLLFSFSNRFGPNGTEDGIIKIVHFERYSKFLVDSGQKFATAMQRNVYQLHKYSEAMPNCQAIIFKLANDICRDSNRLLAHGISCLLQTNSKDLRPKGVPQKQKKRKPSDDISSKDCEDVPQKRKKGRTSLKESDDDVWEFQ